MLLPLSYLYPNLSEVADSGGQMHKDKETVGQTDRETERHRQTDRDRETQTDRQTERHRQTDRDRETQTDRKTERQRETERRLSDQAETLEKCCSLVSGQYNAMRV